jgi:hypothetical protein
MAVYVECGNAGAGGLGVAMPVEVGSEVHFSESLATTGVSTAAPSDCVMTLTSDANGYAVFGPGTPNAGTETTRRRRLLSGVPRSFAVRKGDKVSWVEG